VSATAMMKGAGVVLICHFPDSNHYLATEFIGMHTAISSRLFFEPFIGLSQVVQRQKLAARDRSI
jgi:hypothetical protein